MGVYGKAAVKAVNLVVSGDINSPECAWKEAVKVFTESEKSQKKGCPKETFLSL